MTDANPAATPGEATAPLAADPAQGTDAAIPAESAATTGAGSSKPFWARLDSPFTVGFLLTLGGLAAVLLGIAITNIATILIYIALAAFASLGLDPVLKWFERHNVSRVWAIVIVFLIFGVLLIGLIWLVVPTLVDQISQFVTGIPQTITAFQNTDFFHWLEGIFGDGLATLVGDLQSFITNPANIAAISGGLLKVGAGIATAISGGLIIIVLTLYFVASLPAMKESLTQFAPARNRPKVRRMTDEITDSVGSYLMGMVILAFFNSIVAFLLHFFLQLPYPLLMGVLAFMITIIPLVGPVLYWITASVLALFTSPVAALIFAIAYLIYIQIEAYVITPRVMSKAISIPGSLVVIGALIGGTLLGLLGALIAVPVTASILLIIKQVFLPKQDAKI
ncbi:putative PurR-regulated permease PerM [Microbacterium terrae]|uniref:Pheromone autoinducer 2 transporter n=1 Tax=Microbacterium terrae TaxID=69369 RepID=A0A0M2H3Y8_9MICO|nr:AI-2E family transporter [Microbacterium terrae]KJL38500.1 pheromone autoinducer 2 transporter [Microbacterium terrae]MBP1078857.1 putative PurR-regulated permease PerM [Microbacterium terrae]GLJ98257.1 AI-2E family transporter [Microbacterium terrae]